MATKEIKPVGPMARKPVKFTDSLVEVIYMSENRARYPIAVMCRVLDATADQG